MRLIAILFCLLTACNGIAQVPEKFRKAQKLQELKNMHGPRILFKVAPLTLLDDYSFPTVQGGVEVALGPKIGWYNEFGFRYRKGKDAFVDTSFLPSTGYKLKSELRYYFKLKYDAYGNWLRDHYVAVNFYYTRSEGNADVAYYYHNDSTTRLYDNFGVTKNIWGLNVIYGWQTELSKRFLVDVYGGLGTRFRDIVTVNKQFDPELDNRIGPRHPNVYNVRDKAEAKGGKSSTINISFGARFACRLF
jgi:hypothetical protein